MQLSLVNLVVKVIFHMAKISWLYIKGQHSKTLCQNLGQLISKFTLHLNLCTWFKFHGQTRNVFIGHGCPHTPLFYQSYDSRSNIFCLDYMCHKLKTKNLLLSKGQELYNYWINPQANPKMHKYTCWPTFL
jgi:hypothetical protein